MTSLYKDFFAWNMVVMGSRGEVYEVSRWPSLGRGRAVAFFSKLPDLPLLQTMDQALRSKEMQVSGACGLPGLPEDKVR